MLVAIPPSIIPIFNVVSSSIRPILRVLIAFAAATIECIPFSGAKPACEDFPFMVTVKDKIVGALKAAKPTGPVKSRIYASFDFILEKSKC